MKITTDIQTLKLKSKPVTEQEAETIIKQLEETLSNYNGYGLSAIQIGIQKRVGIIRMKDCNLDLINPVIIEKQAKFRCHAEACLSLPGISFPTKRYERAVIETGFAGHKRTYYLTGLEAVVAQHEVNHMDGKTIFDVKWRRR